VEIDPKEGFGPLKNASGVATDTPEMVRSMMIAQHRRWLQAAGATVAEGVGVEISPLFALDDEELARKLPKGLRVETTKFFE
jgi:UDP-N-acetylglucosamine/UDP-N-acetylgalactosamine diphosphorylase